MTTFASLNLLPFLNEALERMNITTPTPIQAESIPFGLKGRDVLGTAQTGTGKTLSYLIPLLTRLVEDPTASALIMAPTRELASQIQDAARSLCGKAMHLNMALLIGGDPMHKQMSALKKNPRFIVGTPGRLNDHLARRTLRLQDARFLVLDETDRMLDMGFTEDLQKIVKCLPKERQTFMFSATMAPVIKTLSMTYLTNPEHVTIGSASAPSLQITQESLRVSANDKFSTLLQALEDREGSVIVFVKTKHGADRLAEKLNDQHHVAAAIHGDLKQRKRDMVIRDFRNLKNRIMVATDLAARGLDIPHIRHVINYDLPQCPEDYIHRIGRTGRAGLEGHALSLIAPEDNIKWRRIHNLINPGQPLAGGGGASNDDRARRKGPGEGAGFRKRKAGEGGKPAYGKPRSSSGGDGYKPRYEGRTDENRSYHKSDGRPQRSEEDRPFYKTDARPQRPEGDRPFYKRDDRPQRSATEGERAPRSEGERPFRKSFNKPYQPAAGGSREGRPMTEGKRPFGGGGKKYGKPSSRPEGDSGVHSGPKAFRPSFQKTGGHKPGGAFKPKRSA